MASREFTFYRTVYPKIETDDPITIGYNDTTPKVVDYVKKYPGPQFIHSGNFWKIPKEKRTPKAVLEGAEKLYTPNTEGIMSVNISPTTEEKLWTLPEGLRIQALDESLKNANWMKDNMDLDAPLYCSFEVGTIKDATKYYNMAQDAGHDAFGAGFSLFLRRKTLIPGQQQMCDVIASARSIIGDAPFHCSGVSSLKLIPIIYYLGATSCDGSTPVVNAAAYGTVFNLLGKSVKASDIKEWTCQCCVCRDENNIIKKLKKSIEYRIRHNIQMWFMTIRGMVRAKHEDELIEFIGDRVNKTRSNILNQCWEYAKTVKYQMTGEY